MLNGNTVSSQDIIRECYRDYKYKYQLPYQDALEWVVDSILLIGAPMALEPVQGKIKISNYRGHLPCDLESIEQAAGSFDGCVPFPMRSNTNTFHPVFNCKDKQILPTLIAEANIAAPITQPIGQDISGNPVYTFQNGNMSMPETITATSQNVAIYNDPTYNVNDGFIFTNFKDGWVFLAYMAFPIDEDGFPLIPDNRRFKEAVKSFIRMKIDYILWRSGELDEKMFNYSEKEWLFYVASASNAAKMPNKDGMFSLMNQLRLIPQKYSHNNFFRSLGS